MTVWTDVCVNITNSQFKNDGAEVIQRAIDNGVTRMLLVGTSVETSLAAIEWCERFPNNLRCTVGCHPHDAQSMNEQSWQELEGLLAASSVVAVGECGLDFNRNYSSQESQLEVFSRQLEMATEYHLPIYLHERDAHQEMVSFLHQFRGRIGKKLLHCFTGDEEQVKNYLELDCHIGVTGWVSDDRRNQDLLKALQLIPNERLLLETDAPFLMPKTLDTKPANNRCEPIHLKQVCKDVAKLKSMDDEDLAKMTTVTSSLFFEWPIDPD